MKSFLLGLLSVTLFSSYSFAVQNTEPAYCNPATFYSKEFKMKTQLERAHLYTLGSVKLLGVAVGGSDTQDLIHFATSHSNTDSLEKYCTWYLNKGDDNAEAAFNHHYVNNPSSLNITTGPAQYRQVLKDEFAKARPNFLNCIEQNKYLAMGCNGQKHRGPTVFGMLLAFSGCSPQNAATIVNKVWGLNGVKPEVRLAIINEGKLLGDEDPEARDRMQKAFNN